MSPDLEAVLALQAEDTIVAQLNAKLRALDAKLKALDGERAQLEDSLARAQATAEQEEKRRRELAIKVEDHKAMQERNLATLDVVRKPKEATAAMAQVDMLKKVLTQEETELHSLSLRVHDVHHAIDGPAEGARRARRAAEGAASGARSRSGPRSRRSSRKRRAFATSAPRTCRRAFSSSTSAF